MTEEQMALLDQLFEAASAVPEKDRHQWLSENCNDPEVRAELESLLPYSSPPGGFTRAVQAAAALTQSSRFTTGHRIGPYSICGVLGEGGMGTVYEGLREDGEFRQKVALKVLRISSRSDASHKRFVQERKILAELEHPNIARMFDGGTADDGSPYIVMERIEGEPLVAFAESRKLTLRQRLELFRPVANAVQYAHQKLIVHRDLKPGNILVTSDGVPKLLDFGIAKLLDAGTAGEQAFTVTGFHLMTPDYASPEQVMGKPVTVASDVYSLGAVLYELLTGVRPHALKSYDAAEIAENICTREVPAPSSTGVAALHGDLDIIILKAMHKEPDRRYNSAEQFCEDLRRYLGGMPVLARPDTAGYRLRKFARRNWIPLSAAAAVFAALSIGVGVSLYQARLANERFELVRALANRFLFDFHHEIVNIAGTTKAQQMVVTTAVEYLEKLGKTAGNDRAVLQDMAEAYSRLASVQGGNSIATLGHVADAKQSALRSVAYYRRLVSVDPSKRNGLANSLMDLSFIETRLEQQQEAMEHSRESAALLQSLVTAQTRDQSLLDDTGWAFLYYARALRASGNNAEALVASRKSEEYFRQMLTVSPSAEAKYGHASALGDLGELAAGQGDLDSAIQLMERAAQGCRELMAAEPANRKYQRFLMYQSGELAERYFSLDVLSVQDARKADSYNEPRLQLMRSMVASDPADLGALLDLGLTESESSIPLAQFDAKGAVRLAESGLRHIDAVLRARPGDDYTGPRRARAEMRLGYALQKAGRIEEAIQRTQLAVTVLRQHLAKKPDDAGMKKSMLLASAIAADALAAGNRDSDARKLYDEAVAFAEQLKSDPSLATAVFVTDAFDRYGTFLKSRGIQSEMNRAQARQWFTRSRDLWASRVEKTTAVEFRRRQAEERLHEL